MVHPVDIRVGRRLRQFRLMRGMTQREVAEGAGVRMQQLQKYENATNRVSASRMWDIANVLGVPVSALFEGQAASGGPDWVDGEQVRLLQLYSQFPGPKRAALIEFIEALAEPGRRRAPRSARDDSRMPVAEHAHDAGPVPAR